VEIPGPSRRAKWIVGWGVLLFSVMLSGLLCETAWGQAADAVTPAAVKVAEAAESLPDVSSLLHDVERNADAMEKMRRDYTYHVRTEEQDLDGKGDVKKTKVTDSESVSTDDVRVDRVVARDGKALTPDEAKKESDRVDKEVAKGKERRAKLEGKGAATDSRGDQVLTLSRILQLGAFSNERRVEMDGRPVIVVDYAGDPKAKTENRFETVFRDLVGTVWIDEKDRELVQVQGHFLNDFKIGGGLIADVRKGTSFSGKWAKVNGEVWLPVEYSGEGKARLLLFVGFSGRMRLVTSDYKKFRASATMVPGEREVGADGSPVVEPEKKP
jgi:hypothetical protein